jgi:cobalt/nickel transport system ATP-binding protein
MVMVTHDLPYAYELCARSVILKGGVIVADGSTHEILTNSALLVANRLELPVGFSIQ